MASVKPFKIEIPDQDLQRLKQKLEDARLPEAVIEDDWEYGTPAVEIERLTKSWANHYDWRKHEAMLNELPHYTANIVVDGFDPLNIHFVHQKSPSLRAVPLLFIHGWPGSFYEATRLLPLLANPGPNDPHFHVIVPSLPNFGFSSAVRQKGFAITQYAECMHRLMLALGYPEYVTQGGDWGFFISRAMGHLYPNHVKAMHTNFVNAAIPSATSAPLHFATSMLKFLGHAPYIGALVPRALTYSDAEIEALKRAREWFEGDGRGYFALLSTKPATAAHLLSDSPLALLAFIYEKLHDWSDDYPFTDDEILTWVSIYWFSKAGPGASGFIYREAVKQMKPTGSFPMTKLQSPVKMPLGLCYLPKELINMPRSWASGLGRIVHTGIYDDKGGHFAAYERPDAIAKDLKTMFGKNGGAFGVVDGCSGFEA